MRFLSEGSLASLSLISLMQSPMGTKGKRASASYENCFDPGLSLISLIFFTNSAEFLQMYGELRRRGFMMAMATSFSCAEPM